MSNLFRLEGAPTFRDLGGLPTMDGRQVKYKFLYRSENLASLTPDDLKRLQPLEIKVICDLRSESERSTDRGRWPKDSSPYHLYLNISTDVQAINQNIQHRMSTYRTPDDARNLMTMLYREMPRVCSNPLSRLFDLLCTEEGSPALIHCTAGKDRTGFFCAILLSALGVAPGIIMEDYLRTNDLFIPGKRITALTKTLTARLGKTPPASIVNSLIYVHQEYLMASFSQINHEFGSMQAYLQEECLLTPDKSELLKDRYLEDCQTL